MNLLEKKHKKTVDDILMYLAEGGLFIKQLKELTQKNENYLRKILKKLVEESKVYIKVVWMGKAEAFLYTLEKQVIKEPQYNKLLTMKW